MKQLKRFVKRLRRLNFKRRLLLLVVIAVIFGVMVKFFSTAYYIWTDCVIEFPPFTAGCHQEAKKKGQKKGSEVTSDVLQILNRGGKMSPNQKKKETEK